MKNKYAYQIVKDSKPKNNYLGAIVGCGRMGSTIDDEHIGMSHYPWPWAHAPAMIEASGVKLVAGVDVDKNKLSEFGKRWEVTSLYSDIQEMVEKENPDIVSVTTGPKERAEVIRTLAKLGVKAIFATKPLCSSLSEADEIVDVCNKYGTLLSIACHLNWYAPYTAARELIASGEIGELRSIVCNTPSTLSNIGSHTLALARLFVDSPAKWVFGDMDNEDQVISGKDLSGSGYIVYENGVRCILNSHVPKGTWSIEFLCEKGRILSKSHHAQFELWTQDVSVNDRHDRSISNEVQKMFPYPWRPRSSMVDAIEGVAKVLDDSDYPDLCPGEYGREALEIAVALRESYKLDGQKIKLPLCDRSLSIEQG